MDTKFKGCITTVQAYGERWGTISNILIKIFFNKDAGLTNYEAYKSSVENLEEYLTNTLGLEDFTFDSTAYDMRVRKKLESAITEFSGGVLGGYDAQYSTDYLLDKLKDACDCDIEYLISESDKGYENSYFQDLRRTAMLYKMCERANELLKAKDNTDDEKVSENVVAKAIVDTNDIFSERHKHIASILLNEFFGINWDCENENLTLISTANKLKSIFKEQLHLTDYKFDLGTYQIACNSRADAKSLTKIIDKLGVHNSWTEQQFKVTIDDVCGTNVSDYLIYSRLLADSYLCDIIAFAALLKMCKVAKELLNKPTEVARPAKQLNSAISVNDIYSEEFADITAKLVRELFDIDYDFSENGGRSTPEILVEFFKETLKLTDFQFDWVAYKNKCEVRARETHVNIFSNTLGGYSQYYSDIAQFIDSVCDMDVVVTLSIDRALEDSYLNDIIQYAVLLKLCRIAEEMYNNSKEEITIDAEKVAEIQGEIIDSISFPIPNSNKLVLDGPVSLGDLHCSNYDKIGKALLKHKFNIDYSFTRCTSYNDFIPIFLEKLEEIHNVKFPVAWKTNIPYDPWSLTINSFSEVQTTSLKNYEGDYTKKVQEVLPRVLDLVHERVFELKDVWVTDLAKLYILNMLCDNTIELSNEPKNNVPTISDKKEEKVVVETDKPLVSWKPRKI